MSALRNLLNYCGLTLLSDLHAETARSHAEMEQTKENAREVERHFKLEKNALWHDAYRRGILKGRETPGGIPLCPNEECTRPMVMISRANWICLPCAQLPERQPLPAPPPLPPFGGEPIQVRRNGELMQRYHKVKAPPTQVLHPSPEWHPTTDKIQAQWPKGEQK